MPIIVPKEIADKVSEAETKLVEQIRARQKEKRKIENKQIIDKAHRNLINRLDNHLIYQGKQRRIIQQITSKKATSFLFDIVLPTLQSAYNNTTIE